MGGDKRVTPDETRRSVSLLLRQRNERQVAPFRELVGSFRVLAKTNVELSIRNSELEQNNTILRLDNTRISSELATIQSDGDGKCTAEVQAKCEKLEKDLMDSWRVNSENAKHIMDMSRKLKEANEDLLLKVEELEKAEERIGDLDARLAKREEELKALEVTHDLMKNEFQSVRVQLIHTQEEMAKVTKENDDLIERWMASKMAQAEKINEINEMYMTAVRAQKQAQAAQAGTSVVRKASEDLSSYAGVGSKSNLPRKVKKVISAHRGDVNSIDYDSSGSLLVSGGIDKFVKLWDTRAGQPTTTLSGPVQSVMSVRFSPNDNLVMGASNDHSIRLWATREGRVRHTLTGHVGKVFGGAFSQDNRRLVSGSHDRTLKIWDIEKGYCTNTVFCFSSCNDVVFTTLTNMIATAHMDSTLRFWDIKSVTMVHDVQNLHTSKLTSVEASPDGQTVLTCSRDGTLKLCDLRTYAAVQTYKDPNFRVGLDWVKARFSSDGQYVVGGSSDGVVFIWDTSTGELRKSLANGHKKTVICVSWNPLGHQLATADRDGNIVLWEP